MQSDELASEALLDGFGLLNVLKPLLDAGATIGQPCLTSVDMLRCVCFIMDSNKILLIDFVCAVYYGHLRRLQTRQRKGRYYLQNS